MRTGPADPRFREIRSLGAQYADGIRIEHQIDTCPDFEARRAPLMELVEDHAVTSYRDMVAHERPEKLAGEKPRGDAACAVFGRPQCGALRAKDEACRPWRMRPIDPERKPIGLEHGVPGFLHDRAVNEIRGAEEAGDEAVRRTVVQV